jgi:hypothetical protein
MGIGHHWPIPIDLRPPPSTIEKMKIVALWAYRVLYFTALALLFIVLIRRLPLGESLRSFEVPLIYVFMASVALAVIPGIVFVRSPEWMSWAATLFLSVMFIWFAWFSLGAPFVLHELHTFDPVEAAKEVNSYRTQSLSATVVIVGFFLLLPALRHYSRKATR